MERFQKTKTEMPKQVDSNHGIQEDTMAPVRNYFFLLGNLFQN